MKLPFILPPHWHPSRWPPEAATHVFLGTCLAFVLVFLIWASFGRLEVVSAAMGEVVPFSKLQSVQHLEGGIVRKILVREGDTVEADQPLVELEPNAGSADVNQLAVRLDSLSITIARLTAEVEGRDTFVLPKDLAARRPEMARQAHELFTTRETRVQSQMNEQAELVKQRDQDIKEVSARIETNRESLKLVQEQVKISEELLKLNLTHRMKHLDLKRELTVLKGRIAEDEAILPRVEAAKAEAEARLESLRGGLQEESRKALEEAEVSFQELTQKQRKLEDNLLRTVLRAPLAGIVKTLHVNTEGGVVKPGDTVVDIVPAGERLVVEAQLPIADIGYVRPGQKVTLRLSSAEAARFGVIEAEVAHVSPDTNVTRQGVPYYKVRIYTDKSFFEKGDLRYNLFPGMQLACSIRIGSRTVMDYLLDPYINSMGQALRER